MHHDDVGHFAFDKTYELISSKFWFKNMRKIIHKYVKNCLNCLYFKLPGGKSPGSLHPIKKVPRPFHTIHIDHLGPFIKSKMGNTHLLVVIDAFTKFILLYPVRNTKTSSVIKSLKEAFKIFGAPNRIIADRGTCFTSAEFGSFCKSISIHLHLTAVGMPRGNGQVERYNRTILDSLATMGGDKIDRCWDKNILNIQIGLNGSLNRSIGISPSEALIGIRVSLQGINNVDNVVDVTAVRANMQNQIKESQEKQKVYFDKGRNPDVKYKVGDMVLVRILSLPATGQSKKLCPKWRGPYQVYQSLENDRYEVGDIPGVTRKRVAYRGVHGVDNMRPWIMAE